MRRLAMAAILSLLHQDHVNYARLLNLMEKEINSLSHGGNANYILLYDIMSYMCEYPDVVHHPMEETMFSVLPEFTDNENLLEDIKALSIEHDKIYESGKKIKEDIHQVIGGQVVEKTKILNDANNYLLLLRTHMDKEEGKVFKKIKSELSPSQLKKLDELAKEENDPLFGSIVKDQFNSLHLGILRMASVD